MKKNKKCLNGVLQDRRTKLIPSMEKIERQIQTGNPTKRLLLLFFHGKSNDKIKIRELDLEFIGKSTEFERNQWKRLNCVLQDERTQSHSIKKKSRARNLNWKPKKKTQHTEWSLPWTIYISVVSLWKKKSWNDNSWFFYAGETSLIDLPIKINKEKNEKLKQKGLSSPDVLLHLALLVHCIGAVFFQIMFFFFVFAFFLLASSNFFMAGQAN